MSVYAKHMGFYVNLMCVYTKHMWVGGRQDPPPPDPTGL